ncbi:MAG: polysaccharide deacetylase family protein [Verrucomicrobiae bacterium]|nr:polysaccharide deacetylase family protein [Verrucomicrobiae bacterium]
MKRLAKYLLMRFGWTARQIRDRQDSFVMMFHGVGDRDMPREKFIALLEELNRLFRIRPMDELPDAISLSKSSPDSKPSLFLTFDDGLKNNHSIAYPILLSKSIPATFFLCPGLIGSGQWIWTHEMRSRLRSLSPDSLVSLATDVFGTTLSVEEIIRRLKTSTLSSRLEIQEEIRSRTARFCPTEAMHDAFDLMSWKDAKSLDPSIVTIGSHTMTHQMLDSATEEEIESEVGRSRTALEENLGRTVRHFCYPDGRHRPEAVEAVRRHYQSAVTTKSGTITGCSDPHLLSRVGSDPDLPEGLWRLARSPGRP